MRFWKRKASIVQTKMVSTEQMELETAKQILSEIFHARPSDVEEMIQRRLEEKNSPVEYEDVLWPSTFCLAD